MTGPIGRIVVPLDAASENRIAIDTAVRVAARAKAPLHGVFIEEEELLNLASLPFVRQVTFEGRTEALTKENIELQLRAEAARAQTELFAAAERHRVKCSFEIVRGASGSAMPAASERDLVVSGALRRPVGGHFRIERRWWSSIDIAPRPFLLARNVWTTPGSVVMLLRDHGDASVRLFEVALEVTAAKDSQLTVICSPTLAGTEGFDKWVADRVKEHPIRFQVEVTVVGLTDLSDRLGQLDCRLLAFNVGLAEASGERLREIAERFTSDILIV